jgi:hypothetical protein
LITTTTAERAVVSVVAYETLAAPASTATTTRAVRTARRRRFKNDDIEIPPLVTYPGATAASPRIDLTSGQTRRFYNAATA